MLLIVRQLRLSEIVSLSLASPCICDIISAPASGMLNTQAVMYWYWGPQDRRIPFAETEQNVVRFAPVAGVLRRILNHLCMFTPCWLLWQDSLTETSGMRDQISESLYEHFVGGMEQVEAEASIRRARRVIIRCSHI